MRVLIASARSAGDVARAFEESVNGLCIIQVMVCNCSKQRSLLRDSTYVLFDCSTRRRIAHLTGCEIPITCRAVHYNDTIAITSATNQGLKSLVAAAWVAAQRYVCKWRHSPTHSLYSSVAYEFTGIGVAEHLILYTISLPEPYLKLWLSFCSNPLTALMFHVYIPPCPPSSVRINNLYTFG